VQITGQDGKEESKEKRRKNREVEMKTDEKERR
jgi:hypothetical protein